MMRTEAALMLLPLIAGQFGVQILSGYVIKKTGTWKMQLYASSGMYAIGLGLFSLVKQNTGLAEPLIYLTLCGIGAGTSVSVSQIALLSSIPRSDKAVAMGTRSGFSLCCQYS